MCRWRALGRNDAQNLGLYGVGPHHHTLVDGLDDSLDKRVLKPLGRVRVVEVRRRVVDDTVHVSVMDCEQEVPPLAVAGSVVWELPSEGAAVTLSLFKE